jgi:hypothetical protein
VSDLLSLCMELRAAVVKAIEDPAIRKDTHDQVIDTLYKTLEPANRVLRRVYPDFPFSDFVKRDPDDR